MTDKEAIKKALKVRNWTQSDLAKETGRADQRRIANIISANTKSMRVDTMVLFLTAMGFELVARDRMGAGMEYVIDMKPTEAKKDDSAPAPEPVPEASATEQPTMAAVMTMMGQLFNQMQTMQEEINELKGQV